MPGRNPISADLARNQQQLIELQMVVAQGAWNGCAAGKVIRHKWTHDIPLEAGFVIHDVIGDADGLGHATRVVHIIQRTAPSHRRFG